MSLCILAGGKLTTLAVAAFTLSWTHSVEKVRWEEDWRVMPSGLEIVEARVKGSGAGMEPPENAVLEDGWWRYRPSVQAQRELVLAASRATGEGWTICGRAGCLKIDEAEGGGRVVTLRPCALGFPSGFSRLGG